MQQQMRYEAEYFDEKKRLLRAIFNETLTQCNEALNKKNVSKDKFQEMSLKCDDERYIRNMLDNPISIVLMGNRPSVKARIVNYMLGYELLPVFDLYDPDYKQPRRAVRIQYGTQRRHAFCIKHFELLECSPMHTERVVSFEDLRLDCFQNDPLLDANMANSAMDGYNICSNGSDAVGGDNVDGHRNSMTLDNGINGGSGNSNTSSGLDSAGNDRSNTPTTLSSNSSYSLIKSAPFQGTAPINADNQITHRFQPTQTNGVSHSRMIPNNSKNGTETNTVPAHSSAPETNLHCHENPHTGQHHRHEHSSGYSSQQNMAGPKINKQQQQQQPHSFVPYDDDEDDDDDDDYLDEVLSRTDSVNEMTTMEIVLPHELLEKNLQIRVAPDVESFDLIYKTTFTRTNPIIIYCFERYDDQLSATDRRHLAQLRQRMPSTPIFFAHIMDFDSAYHTAYHHHHHHQQRTSPQPMAPYHHLESAHFPYSNTYRLSDDQLPTLPSPIVSKLLFGKNKAQQNHPYKSNQLQIMETNGGHCCAHNAPVKLTAMNGHGDGDGDVTAKTHCGSSSADSSLYNINQLNDYEMPEADIDDRAKSNNNKKSGPVTRRNTHCCGDKFIKRKTSYSANTSPSASSTSINSQRKSYLQASESLWKQLRSIGFFKEMPSTLALQAPMDRRQKYQSNGYYIINDGPFKCTKQNSDNGMDVSSRFICHSYEFCYFVDFFRSILKSNLVVAATLLNEIHNQFIQYHIFTAFDMTWSLNYCIPKRLEYARNKEAELYMSLMGIANRKQEEIRQLIGETLKFMRDDILEQAANYMFANNQFNCNPLVNAGEVKQCAEEIQDFVFMTLNRAIAVKLIGSVDIMRESFIGTLERCLKQLEEYRYRKNLTAIGDPATNATPTHNNVNHQQHHQQQQVRLMMVGDDSKNAKSKRNNNGASAHHQNQQRAQEEKIDLALSRLLNLAYSIEINANTCSSMLRIFWEKMKNFFLMFSIAWKPTCRIDADWKRKVAADLLNNLSEVKLAKCICTQFREKLKLAHETFLSSLTNLENILMTRLKEIDHRRQQVRKNDAPLFARLALESTSFIDAILYGSPELGKEIGRGQYGVVFSTKKSWGHYSRVAVKSIMICDDKHWNDLAMEFYYTRSLPENDRIVQIRGSIIEHNYNGASSYVYLIMDRMVRDLYAGLKAGLEWLQRLQIAFDVVHGLRFLHNHGLIHRDIKLKNVLLDKQNRAKITDLGFCKSEVMISGSIVGTPIHMAPEVFTGKYDSMVDVYAFGILFWYICAGSVELPQIFEQCHNKDHLWIAVKKGLRPEKLTIFDDECFQLMERCWAGDPTKRPLLGEVEECLLEIKQRYETQVIMAQDDLDGQSGNNFAMISANSNNSSGSSANQSSQVERKNFVGKLSTHSKPLFRDDVERKKAIPLPIVEIPPQHIPELLPKQLQPINKDRSLLDVARPSSDADASQSACNKVEVADSPCSAATV